jgi:hypothetical protein
MKIKPEIYQWSGIGVSSILSISIFCLLFWGTRGWLDQFPNRPLPILPLGLMAPFQAISLFMSGFGARIVMGNVSGNPDVLPARKLYSIWLVLMGLWALVFAGLHLVVPSFALAVLQWGVAFLSLQKFFNVDPKAGRLVVFFFLMTTYWAIVNGFLITFNDNI